MEQALIEVGCNIMERMMMWIISPSIVDKLKIMSPTKSPLDLLPDELLLEIFSYISLPDLAVRICPLGNRRLRRICQDPKRCNSIIVDEMWDKDTARAVLSMVGPNMEELTVAVKRSGYYFKARRAMTHYFNFIVASKPPRFLLQEHLYDEVASDAMLSTLLTIIGQCKSKVTLHRLNVMTKLSLHDPVLCPLTATLIAHAASSLRNLTKIDMGRANFGDRSEDWIKAIADNCVNLEDVRFPMLFSLSHQPFKYFLEHLQGRLKRLEMYSHGSRITPDACCALKLCQRLEVLKVGRASHMSPKALKTIFGLPKLQRLYISEAFRITGDDIVEALRNKMMPAMACLEMNRVSAFDDDRALQAISMSCPNLLGLFLIGYRRQVISDIGIMSLLDRCKKIAFIYSQYAYASPSINNCCYRAEVISCEARKKVKPLSTEVKMIVQKYFREN